MCYGPCVHHAKFYKNRTSNKKFMQGSKIALVRSYLRVPQAAGQVENLIFLVKINFFPIYANNFCDAGQVPILRYFEPCYASKTS